MICKKCNGKIKFEDGKARCLSCGTLYECDYGFDSNEVVVVNQQDKKERKISEDIYYQLDSLKIKTFQKELSCGGLSDNEKEGAMYQAIFNSKIIVLVGTTPEAFDSFLEIIEELSEDKIIIPVYSLMDVNLLPEELKKYQAQNFDKIAALTDLSNSIVNILKREKRNQKSFKIALLIIVGMATIAISIYFLILSKNGEKAERITKETDSDLSVTETPLDEQTQIITEQEIYEQANNLYNEGKFLEAAELYREIYEYKDVQFIVESIYNRYDGYYQTENLDYTFYIDISNSKMSRLSFEKNDGMGKTMFTESAELIDNSINAAFQDSEEGKGVITVTLHNESIDVNIVQEGVDTIGNVNKVFLLDEKKDKPMEKGITADVLYSWLDNRISLSDINRLGYEIEFDEYLTAGGGTLENAVVYYINNTDIKLLFLNYDLINTNDYWSIEDNKLDGYYLYGIIGTAEMLLEEYEQLSLKPIMNEEYVIVPSVMSFQLCSLNGDIEYCAGFYFTEEYKQYTQDELIENQVKKDTMIGIISSKQIGDNKEVVFNWQNMQYESVY